MAVTCMHLVIYSTLLYNWVYLWLRWLHGSLVSDYASDLAGAASACFFAFSALKNYRQWSLQHEQTKGIDVP